MLVAQFWLCKFSRQDILVFFFYLCALFILHFFIFDFGICLFCVCRLSSAVVSITFCVNSSCFSYSFFVFSSCLLTFFFPFFVFCLNWDNYGYTFLGRRLERFHVQHDLRCPCVWLLRFLSFVQQSLDVRLHFFQLTLILSFVGCGGSAYNASWLPKQKTHQRFWFYLSNGLCFLARSHSLLRCGPEQYMQTTSILHLVWVGPNFWH